MTGSDAGDSYDPYFTALRMLDSAKTNINWSEDYRFYWQNVGRFQQTMEESGYPTLQVSFDPVTGQIVFDFDQEAADQWIANNQDLLQQWHAEAAEYANTTTNPNQFETEYFEPGTQRYDDVFNYFTTTSRNNGGTLFFDNSKLYHVQGEYKFEPGFVDSWRVGGNYRLYTPESNGTIFYDTAGISITNSEFGVYTGVEHGIFDQRLKLQATVRMDKNENFDVLFSPAASLVWKPRANNYLRASFSSAIRNPTLTDQYLFLNVGPATLGGNLDGVQDLWTLESLSDFLNTQDPNTIRTFNIDPVRPEKVRTAEVGYRTTLFNNLYMDAGYYYSTYTDFLGFNIGAEVVQDEATGRITDVDVFRYSANSTETVTTQGFNIGLNFYFWKYYALNGNYSWNKLNTETDDPIVPAFNTPEHKYNIGISGRNMPISFGGKTYNGLSFNVNYKWIEGFLFEGSPQFTGFIPTYDLLDAQISYRFNSIGTTVKIGASNLLDNQQFQTYGGPRIGRLAYVSAIYEWEKKD